LNCLFVSGDDKNVFGADGALDAGLHFLQKPFSHTDLARLVRELIDSAQA
jgi:hypothetical protein